MKFRLNYSICLLMVICVSCKKSIQKDFYKDGSVKSIKYYSNQNDNVDSIVCFFENSPHTVQQKERFISGVRRMKIIYDNYGHPVEYYLNDQAGKQNINITYVFRDKTFNYNEERIAYLNYINYSEIYSVKTFDSFGKEQINHFRIINLRNQKTLYKINKEFENDTLKEIFLYDSPTGSKRQLYSRGNLIRIISYKDTLTKSVDIKAGNLITDSLRLKTDSLEKEIHDMKNTITSFN
jgi:hypothetical protein